MKKAGYGISYRKRMGSGILLLLICSVFMVSCGTQEQYGESKIVNLEASSMQAWNPTENADETLVETKDEQADNPGTGEVAAEANDGKGDSSQSTDDLGEKDESKSRGEAVNGQEDAVSAEVNKSPVAGTKTLANLLLTAKQPLGNTMYIWGGGWNEEDTGAGEEARSIGVSPRWAEFAQKQDASYDYNNTRYQIHDGLDCSGYVGWVIYNVFESTDGNEGYVMGSTGMAQNFAERGWGEYTPTGQVSHWQAGDIMSMKGHVWISLGMCEDGSVVLLHASPPGVILCGTALADGGKSQAVLLAEEYMSAFYPEWYGKYPDCSRSYSYLTNSSRMRWNREVLTDEEGLADMSAAEVLAWLFGELPE